MDYHNFISKRSHIMKKNKWLLGMLSLSSVLVLGACSGTQPANSTSSGTEDDQLVIYTNADEEAVEAMEESLTENGMEGQYVVQTFGTAELGGKLLAEGSNTEADIVTMSSYYLDSAQEKNQMFKEFEVDVTPIEDLGQSFHYPVTVQEGTIFYNTVLSEEKGLEAPTSYKDLADAAYAGNLSVSDINQSSTAWLMIQALLDNYGEDEAVNILADIYTNAGDHISDSGSAPLKSVRGGEVATGAGLRHQAIRSKNEGEPIEYVDPSEGTYLLTEDIAIVDKGEETNTEQATKAANIILSSGREKLLEFYPVAIYDGESADSEYAAKNYKTFGEPLTTELLEKHQEISNQAREQAGL